ncbi:MAG TPA: hypothetical protein VGE81_04245 [Candidatus Limnocylindrales bacterium]
MHWLRRHQSVVLLVVLVVATWSALWLVYDYRSPVSQFLRAYGAVQIDGWSTNDLDALCIRLEPANGTPQAGADAAIAIASKTYAGGYVLEVLLVSLHDTCNGAEPRLAWAVAMAWAESSYAPTLLPGESRPRAVVLVDASTGKLIVSHAEGLP